MSLKLGYSFSAPAANLSPHLETTTFSTFISTAIAYLWTNTYLLLGYIKSIPMRPKPVKLFEIAHDSTCNLTFPPRILDEFT
jgi:hypothetical protein